MDDSRIRQLTADVLAQVRGGGPAPSLDFESRLAALEAAVARLERRQTAPAEVQASEIHVHTHPSLRVLHVAGGTDRCLLEPDKPCVQSHACRVLGH